MARFGLNDEKNNRVVRDHAGEINVLNQRLAAMDRTVGTINETMAGMVADPDAALPASPFVIAETNEKTGKVLTVQVLISAKTKSVKLRLINLRLNQSDKPLATARAKVFTETFDDITEEERTAGIIQRVLRPLNANTSYGVVRTIATIEDSVKETRLPSESDSPFKSLPFPLVKKYSTIDRTITTQSACFTTGDSGKTNFQDSCQGQPSSAGVIPRPNPNGYVIANKITDAGVKPVFQFIVHKNTKRLSVVFIRQADNSSGSGFTQIFDIDPSGLTAPVSGIEAEARVFQVRSAMVLDSGATYDTISILAEGESVGLDSDGTTELDKASNPAAGFGAIPNGTFTAGQVSPGVNVLLKEQDPLVINQISDQGFRIRGESGAKAKLYFFVPASATTLRIVLNDVNNAVEDTTAPIVLSYDDIATNNQGAGILPGQLRVSRFTTFLEYNKTYQVKRVLALGPAGSDVGGVGLSSALYLPTNLRFTTPNKRGVFGNIGNALSFVSVTKIRTKANNNVVVTVRINIPRETTRLVVKLQLITPSAPGTGEIIEAVFNEIRSTTGVVEREIFNLQPAVDASPNYGVLELIANGDNINPGSASGSDMVMSPASPLPAGTYLATFNSLLPTGGIGFPGFVVPAVPVASDLVLNTTENGMPRVVFRVFASSARSAAAQGGSGVGGAITFKDVGAAKASVVIKLASDTANSAPITVETVIENTASSFVDVTIMMLTIGSRYALRAAVLANDGGKSRTPATNPDTDIVFDAGLSRDLTRLINPRILQPLKVDSRTSQVTITWDVSALTPAAPRTLILSKDIQNKTGEFKEIARLSLSNDADTIGLPGTVAFNVQATHPAAAKIRYKADLIPLKGGQGIPPFFFPLNQTVPTYDDTSDDPMAMDRFPPLYALISPNLSLRFRPNNINLKFNKPDSNIRTLRPTVVALQFDSILRIGTGPITALQITRHFVNLAEPSEFSTITGIDVALGQQLPSPLPTGGRLFFGYTEIEAGPISFVRPTVNADSDGSIPPEVMAVIRQSFGQGFNPIMRVTVFFVNEYIGGTSPGFPVNYTAVQSNSISFNPAGGGNLAFSTTAPVTGNAPISNGQLF